MDIKLPKEWIEASKEAEQQGIELNVIGKSPRENMTSGKPTCECLKVLGNIAEALALEGQKDKANAVFEAVGQLRTHQILREHMHDPREERKP